MRLFEHSIVIARPREEVFDFFLDFDRSPSWRSYVSSMERLDAGPVREGSRIRATMDVMGEVYTVDMNVLACNRPTLWRHRTNETFFNGYIEYRFETVPEGTRVVMQTVVKPIGLWGFLAMPVMWLYRGKSYRDQLPSLKRAIETGE